MKIKYCPFCKSDDLILFRVVVTEEEGRHTEVMGCNSCHETWFRERIPEIEELDKEKRYIVEMKEFCPIS